MTSGYPGEFMHGGGGTVRPPAIGGTQGGVPYVFRQQQQQFQQPQQQFQQQQFQQPQQQFQQQQQQGMMLQDQINQRRMDLLMGKRSFGDYQSYQHQISLLQQPQPQQQSLSYLQILQQQQQQQSSQQMSMLLRNQNLMRSVKQRTNGFTSSPIIDLSSPTNNNNNNNNNNSLTRFGVPIYQQPRQQPIPLINSLQLNQTSYTQFNPSHNFNNNNNNSLIPPPTFPNPSNNNNTQMVNPAQPGSGLSNISSEDHKILNTLQELEKQLLGDDDYDVTNDQEGDAVSGITNSEWSETFQSLMSPNPTQNPNPNPSPIPNPVPNPNNNVISPSPTSSTSSCCSTSAPATGSPPLTAPINTVAVTLTAKQLICEVATAISDGRNDVVSELFSKLGQISNCEGNSEQRIAYYMSHALKSRACPNENPTPVTELYGSDQMSAVYSLYDISPCFKFGLLAANLVMLEAITGAIQEGLKIHVIDFDVGHGAQYVNLLRALAERRTRLPCIGMKITIVETTKLGGEQGGVVPESVKDGLVALAERVGINLKYECLTRAIHELTRETLGVEEGEAVVVNFAFKLYRVPDESVSMENLRDELLRRVKGLSPRAVTLVEQDMNGNSAPFVTRVNEVCEYYGALFDSLEATLPRDNLDRCRVEKGLGRKMVNSVACEGRERVERAEVFGKWRARMKMAGFELKALGQSVAESMRAKLNSGRGGNPGFTVKEENGGVGFGWMGRSLTAASAWR